MMTKAAPAIGSVVRAMPVGQTRRYLMEVDRVEGGLVFGRLLSRASPGNYRGRAVAWIDACEGAEQPTAIQTDREDGDTEHG